MDATKIDNEGNAFDKTLFDQNAVQNMKSEVVTDEKGKKGIKISNITKEQKEVLMTVGIVGAGLAAGAGAFSLFSFANPDEVIEITPTDTKPENATNTNHNETATESVVIYTDAPFADEVNDNMAFKEAFETAREQIDGGGGVFEWRGNIYNTYSEDEWNTMSEEDKNEYFNSIDANIISDVENSKHDSNDIPTTEPEPNPEPTPIPQPQPSPDNPQPTPEPVPVVIQGIDYDGNGVADVFIIDADGNETPDIMIDSNLDGNLDQLVLNVDINDPNSNIGDHPVQEINISSSELQKISGVEVVTIDGEKIDSPITSNEVAYNDEVDNFSDDDLNPNFDNDLDMSDYNV